MKSAKEVIVAGKIDRGHVARAIRDTLSKEELKATMNMYGRQIIVDVVDSRSKSALTYIVQIDGVIGPDPSKHRGNTRLDALVLNVEEELHARSLFYNNDNGKYEGEFSRF